VALELAGERHELWLDAAAGTAGAYLLTRDERRAIAIDESSGGRPHQALLHVRKRLGGTRLGAIERVPGERALTLTAGPAVVALRLWGPAPSLTLAVNGEPLASLGTGAPAWPPPSPAPQREWAVVEPAHIQAAMGDASPARAILALCPGLGPDLARALARGDLSWEELKERLGDPQPTLVLPAPLESLCDADLAPSGAVTFLPAIVPGLPGTVLRPASWREAAATFLSARRRGGRFRVRRAAVMDEVRRDARRLRALEEHLARDLAGLPPPDELRRQAEALLSSPAAGVVEESNEVVLADPYDSGRRVRVRVDPRLSLPANADRLFDKARRLERARRQVDARRVDTREKLRLTLAREAGALAARDLADLGEAASRAGTRSPEKARGAVPRHYLTARGLSVLVGRGARENHRLTFDVAGPEDLWLHARDVPGAHVILRDPEGRAESEDMREAAELAAFFSDARAQPQADVHVTRRKHVRAARGGHGRVRIAHSDTLRVAPRDPEGRLRRRL
jgi:fibronectin-binding protein A (FbpA)/ribosomal quality control pathway NFACT family protein